MIISYPENCNGLHNSKGANHFRVRRFGEGINEDSGIIVQNLEIKCINK
jgi:hypothetical protein